MIDDKELQAWKAACEAATAGKWELRYWRDATLASVVVHRDILRVVAADVAFADARFLVAANEALPRAIAEIERLSELDSPAPRGHEAEELRRGIEALMVDPPGGDSISNNEWHAELVKLLDRVDARDSLSVLVERDDLKAALAAMTKARDDLVGLARLMWTHNGQVSEAVLNEVEQLAVVGAKEQADG